MSLPSEDKYYNTKNEMLDSIVVLLGGRTAESLVLEDISTGASNDIERASKIARQMVTKFGMSDKIGPISFGSDHDEVFIGRDFVQSRYVSEHVAAEIDEEIRTIIDDCFNKCKDLISSHMDKLENVAQALMKYEKISGEEFETIFNGGKIKEEAEEENKNSEAVSSETAENVKAGDNGSDLN